MNQPMFREGLPKPDGRTKIVKRLKAIEAQLLAGCSTPLPAMQAHLLRRMTHLIFSVEHLEQRQAAGEHIAAKDLTSLVSAITNLEQRIALPATTPFWDHAIKETKETKSHDHS